MLQSKYTRAIGAITLFIGGNPVDKDYFYIPEIGQNDTFEDMRCKNRKVVQGMIELIKLNNIDLINASESDYYIMFSLESGMSLKKEIAQNL